MKRALLTLGLLAALAAPLAPSPAAALSCVNPEGFIASHAVRLFTGRIVNSREDRILIDVGEVWRGDRPEQPVWLRVEMPYYASWARDDGYSPEPMLFAPRGGKVNPCTAWLLTQTLEAKVGHLRPLEPVVLPQVPAPVVAPVQPRSPWFLAVGFGGAVLTAGAAGFALRRRR